jgi:hypothetical protein
MATGRWVYFYSSQSPCDIFGMPTVGVSTESNALAGQTLVCDVNIVSLAWTRLAFKRISDAHKRMTFEIDAFDTDVFGFVFGILVHMIIQLPLSIHH